MMAKIIKETYRTARLCHYSISGVGSVLDPETDPERLAFHVNADPIPNPDPGF